MADVEFRLPKLGMSIVEGTVSEWLVEQGDIVEQGQAMLMVEMDKADTELPAPIAGTVVVLAVPAGTTVEVGAVLAVIRPLQIEN
jgi:pyruvate/2-oxoglutarate dehydrogenase complex dihydrolipoamide acyltransferase (E2) component